MAAGGGARARPGSGRSCAHELVILASGERPLTPAWKPEPDASRWPSAPFWL